MAWMEGKLADIDPRMLLAAIQSRRGGGQGGMQDGMQSGKLKAIQEQLAQQQLESAQIANKKAEMDLALSSGAGATTTVKGIGYDPRTGFGAHKEFLNDMPGYISGVSPQAVFAEQGANTRALMGAMQGGRGGGRERDNEPTPNAPTETANKPDPFNTLMQITQGMKSSGQPTGGKNGQPGGELNNPYYPTSGEGSSISGSPYDPQNVKSLLVEQMLNKDGLTSLANQAGLPQGATDKITSGIDKELLNIVKPINALTNAKQNEINNYNSGVNPSMNDDLVPGAVQQHYKNKKIVAENNKKLADKKKSLDKQSQDELGRKIETHGAALYKDIAWAGDSKNDIAPTIPDDVKQKMKSALPLYLKAAKNAGEAFDLAKFKRDFGY